MGIWHWMYAHPKASPAELRQATMRIARDVWNRYYAPVLGHRDTTLLGIYSHIINAQLYLPDYPIGHLIAFQIEEHLKGKAKKAFGAEVERMTRHGLVTPDAWMQHATGQPVSAAPLLRAAAGAVTWAETAWKK
jgi:oligoendopeptidase F